MGARSNALPVPAGDHMFIFAPSSLQPAAPWTISIATIRFASAPAAADPPLRANAVTGIIASRNGSAMVAPMPRTKVRRGSALSVKMRILLISLEETACPFDLLPCSLASAL